MNAESYFECEPWQYVTDMVHKGELGRVAAFAVQVSCNTGEMRTELQQWQERIHELFGSAAICDKLESEQAVSLLLRYNDSMIGRVFIDQSSDDPFCNVEIVGTDSLLIWKPTACALSSLRTTDKQHAMYQHPYATDLVRKVPS